LRTACRVALSPSRKTSADDAERNLCGMPNRLEPLQPLASSYVLATSYK